VVSAGEFSTSLRPAFRAFEIPSSKHNDGLIGWRRLNKSPRAAVKTSKGRDKVVDWLKILENHTAKLAGHNEEMASYNFNWLWTELGVSELRR
jgi:hypothetical protein